MTGFIRIVAALSGLALFSLFGFVATAAYSATKDQCPDGSDCRDARFVMMMVGALAMMSLGLLIPLGRSIRRGMKGS